jgi:hypothetical protein
MYRSLTDRPSYFGKPFHDKYNDDDKVCGFYKAFMVMMLFSECMGTWWARIPLALVTKQRLRNITLGREALEREDLWHPGQCAYGGVSRAVIVELFVYL